MTKIFHPNRLQKTFRTPAVSERGRKMQKRNRWLAEQLGKSEMTISRWSTNKTQPSLDQLIEIAKLLDVKLDDLLEPYNTK